MSTVTYRNVCFRFAILSILFFSPIKYVRDGNLAVKSILLKDNSTVAKVCLFDKLAENEYAEGNNLQITAVLRC